MFELTLDCPNSKKREHLLLKAMSDFWRPPRGRFPNGSFFLASAQSGRCLARSAFELALRRGRIFRLKRF
jgi:hypothetical protein